MFIQFSFQISCKSGVEIEIFKREDSVNIEFANRDKRHLS